MGVLSWWRGRTSRPAQGGPAAVEPAADTDGDAEAAAQPAPAGDTPAAADTILADGDASSPGGAASDGAGIPRQQSAAEAADSEPGEGART
ncbi:hypothetical protein QNO07_24030 [Streptomyces sp. 549]|uniref:hypothetical protein n=1 Tax=Streptomyces sp. 549 TaxID=3049076 RepID=UPI0024C444BD|nr:hypothetical protein [Streptomyces sp. 549]MDK1476441.1 hypothetical protein [Streptomyces sp. 549]